MSYKIKFIKDFIVTFRRLALKNKIIITIVFLVCIMCAIALMLINKYNTNITNNMSGLDNIGYENEVASENDQISNDDNNENIANSNIGNESSISNNSTQQDDSTTAVDIKANKFKVIFRDFDGRILKTVEVEKGKDAIPPEIPKRKGFIFAQWSVSYENITTDIVTIALYREIVNPTLVLDTVHRSEQELIIKVMVYKNPGLLALIINNIYDEDVMTLEKIENGNVMNGYVFTPPKNMKCGCRFAWNINDVPESLHDGELLTLYYKIKKPIKNSPNPVSITCYDGAFDKNYNVVTFEIINPKN